MTILITAEAEISSIYSEKYQAEGDKKIETFFSIDPWFPPFTYTVTWGIISNSNIYLTFS